MRKYDAVVIGSGPNGLAAAITLAQAHLSVLLIEAKSKIGGGMRSDELTLPGFTHDVCSALHPMGIASPFFSTLPLQKFGLEWVHPLAPLAHPFKEGASVILERSLEKTGQWLGEDAEKYQKLLQPFVDHCHELIGDLLAPLHFPHHPLLMAHFGYKGIQSVERLVTRTFKTHQTKGLFAGLSAHAILPLQKSLTGAFGLVLALLGHAVGWPMVSGGTQNLANALASYFRSLGGEILTDTPIEKWEEIPSAQALFFDVTPKQLLAIVGDRFPSRYRKRMSHYRYGPGVFKIDWALNSPIPWKDKECLRAGVVHLGGTLEEIAESERAAWEGRISEKRFIILTQPTLFDPSRAPREKHVAWGYCHVPHGSTVDMTEKIESEIDQYAPGFRDCIIARKTMNTRELEHHNPNYVGGDINGGAEDIFQFFNRPVFRRVPYSTPIQGLYICSSSTPPGGGVHGMCGYYAARSALKECFDYSPSK